MSSQTKTPTLTLITLALGIGEETIDIGFVRGGKGHENQIGFVTPDPDHEGEYLVALLAPSLDGSKGNQTRAGQMFFMLNNDEIDDKFIARVRETLTPKLRTGAVQFVGVLPEKLKAADWTRTWVGADGLAQMKADRQTLWTARGERIKARDEAAKAAKAAKAAEEVTAAAAEPKAPKAPKTGKAKVTNAREAAIRALLTAGDIEGARALLG